MGYYLYFTLLGREDNGVPNTDKQSQVVLSAHARRQIPSSGEDRRMPLIFILLFHAYRGSYKLDEKVLAKYSWF